MTTILYTPNKLTADGRATVGGDKIFDDDAVKLHSFEFTDDSTPPVAHLWIPYKDDRIHMGAGAGRHSAIQTFFRQFSRLGQQTQASYKAAQAIGGSRLYAETCRVLLVGEKNLWEITIDHQHPDGPWLEKTLPLDQPHAIGNGGTAALALHSLLGLPEALAVAAVGLFHLSTGGDIAEVKKVGRGPKARWKETFVPFRDHHDLIDQLSENLSVTAIQTALSTLDRTLQRKPRITNHAVGKIALKALSKPTSSSTP